MEKTLWKRQSSSQNTKTMGLIDFRTIVGKKGSKNEEESVGWL